MGRAAIFVDAGYLFAQGAAALTGAKKPRTQLRLETGRVIEELQESLESRAPDATLLRVYWYDGTGFRGPTLEQQQLAAMDNVKLRLGFINSQGEQKGVDSLIVTDLVELARNGAISDALLLSGDEDVRIGVQLAQSFGVRVHLLGIIPSRGSQSRQLRHEADTTEEWCAETVARFLTITEPIAEETTRPKAPDKTDEAIPDLKDAATAFAQSLPESEQPAIREHIRENFSIPSEYDGPLLGKARDKIGRFLEEQEKRILREEFKKALGADT